MNGPDLSRRGALKLMALAGGGLLLEGWLPVAAARSPKAPEAPGQAVGYFIEIRPDNSVSFVLTRHEMGQGVGTALAMIVAEELGAAWADMRIRVPDTSDARYQLVGTGGSTTIKDSWLPARRGAALAREALIAAAAKRWQVDAAACRTADTHVLGPDGRKLAFGALAAEAGAAGVPATPAAFRDLRPSLREPAPATQPAHRTNFFATDIVRGKQRYGIDAQVPGMLYASVERSPRLRGKVKRVDASKALQVPGVRQVVQVEPMHDLMMSVKTQALFSSSKAGVAVLADTLWAAQKGRALLEIEWEAPEGPAHDDASWAALVEARLQNDAKPVAETGQAPVGRDADYYRADYVFPYQAHACMEPMNCTAHFKGEKAELWLSTQGAGGVRGRIAQLFKLKPEDVVVHGEFSGGAFGRRFYNDVAVEALRISQSAGGVPVKVVWTREDDLRHDHFHPYYHGRYAALVEPDGRLASFCHDEARAYWGDPSNEHPWFMYDTGHMRYRFADAHTPSPLQGGAWRSVVANNWAFGQECFLDELAHRAGRDPFAWRRQLLSAGVDKRAGNRFTMNNARLLAVLDALEKKAAWGQPAAKVAGARTGRGMAIYPYMHGDSYAGMVIDVAVDAQNKVRVTRVVAVVDCGQVINADGAAQQMEGGILWGLTAALHGGVHLKDGAVVNSNFHDTPVLRHSETPARIDVHFLHDPTRPPTGLGEIAPPLVAPALCNALFAATGQRIRRLPLKLG